MLGILHILVLGQKSAIQTRQQTHYFFLSCKVKVKTFSQLEFDNIKEKQIDFKIRDELKCVQNYICSLVIRSKMSKYILKKINGILQSRVRSENFDLEL